MPIIAVILASLAIGGATAHFLLRKPSTVTIMPNWATAGDLVPNALTRTLASVKDATNFGGGGNAPSPIADLAGVLHAGLAIAAAGVSHGGNPAAALGNPSPSPSPAAAATGAGGTPAQMNSWISSLLNPPTPPPPAPAPTTTPGATYTGGSAFGANPG